MSSRDEMFGVGVYRDDIATESIEGALHKFIVKARTLAWELNGRSATEKLSDAEVDLINAAEIVELYKLKPWADFH